MKWTRVGGVGSGITRSGRYTIRVVGETAAGLASMWEVLRDEKVLGRLGMNFTRLRDAKAWCRRDWLKTAPPPDDLGC